ncbi:phage head completion protein [Streptomyces longwoodensis]|uniref:phage head completion protein n=1 Tax=Streptomyces longwoodensis TaxID=68231 RepID=UPI0033ECFCBF
MIDESLLPHLVVVEHPGSKTDRYGNTVPDWSQGATTRAEVAAWLQQNSGGEDTDQRDAQIGEWLMLCNPETVEGEPLTVHGSDRVQWGELRFEVIGPPGPAYTPDELHHYEIRLKSVEG